MEPDRLHLKISGPLLGKILHERHKHSGKCGGLLYGEIISETRSEITDSQHITKSEAFVCIKDYLPTSNKNFFKSQSSIKADAWMDSSYSPLSSCVGLFNVRNSSNSLSLLEKSMHRKLCKDLDSKPGTTEADFIVSLLITSQANKEATCLDWRIDAFILYKSLFSTIKIEVSNLQGSVNNLYLTNPSPVKSVQSTSTNQLLESFQSYLTDDNNGIKVVEATRKVTKDLIRELDGVFEKLSQNEHMLEEALKEKSALLSEWNALMVKRKLLNSEQDSSPTDVEVEQATGLRLTVDDKQSNVVKTESEYQAVKRRSMEDIRRRSPVVVLEKYRPVDNSDQSTIPHSSSRPNGNSAEDPFANLVSSVKHDSSSRPNGNSADDPFANLVSSVKHELKKDIEEFAGDDTADQKIFSSSAKRNSFA